MKTKLSKISSKPLLPHVVARTVREALLLTWSQMRDNQLFQVASSLAYTTILSIIPLLAMSFAIFKAFGGMERILETIQPFILENLTEGTSEEVMRRMQNFIHSAHGAAVGIGGFLGLVFTSMSMLYSAERAINAIWGARITRSWFQRISSYWLFITMGPVAFGVVLGAATSAQLPLTRLLPGGTGTFLLMVALFFAVFKFVPNTRVNAKYALASAAITSVLWNLARIGYALYTKKFVAYNTIYGSLGAVPILLLWVYIGWIIVLSGAALTAALQKRFEATLSANRAMPAEAAKS